MPLHRLENDTLILIKWFCDYLQLNADKCHLLITNHDNGITMKVGNEIIECKSSVKLRGITIDTKLDFSKHVSSLCKKVSQRLHALARISYCTSHGKLRLLLKAFI